MFDQLKLILEGSGSISAAVLGMLITIYKAVDIFSNGLDLHERHFVRKRFQRLKDLHSDVSQSSPLTRYFEGAIKLEAFRIEFGTRVSPLKADFLLKLWEQGYWDRNQVGQVARFLVIAPGQATPVIRIAKADKVGAWAGLIAAFITIITGAVLWISIALINKSFYSYLAGLGLFCSFTFAAGLFATGYGRYKNALQIKAYVDTDPELFVISPISSNSRCSENNDMSFSKSVERDVV